MSRRDDVALRPPLTVLLPGTDSYQPGGWADCDGDCTTRYDMLMPSSLVPVTMSPDGCRVETGQWIDTKTRWGLIVTADEHDTLRRLHASHQTPMDRRTCSSVDRFDSSTFARYSSTSSALI